MSPEMVERKLALLRSYRADLEAAAAAGAIRENHYAVERMFQLIVECMYDISSHWLAERGAVHPDSYGEVFLEAGRQGMVTGAIAGRLAAAARMRNLLVHAYERIDMAKIEEAIPLLLADSEEFLLQMGKGLPGEGA